MRMSNHLCNNVSQLIHDFIKLVEHIHVLARLGACCVSWSQEFESYKI